MFIAFVTHDVRSNTLEVTWLEEVLDGDGNVTEYKRVKNRNYSADQKDEFLTDCGALGDKYVTMAGW